MSSSTLSWDGVDERVLPFLIELLKFGELGPGLEKLIDERPVLCEMYEDVRNIPPPCDAHLWGLLLDIAYEWWSPFREDLRNYRPAEIETSRRVRCVIASIMQERLQYPDDVGRVPVGTSIYQVYYDGSCTGPVA